MGTVEPRKVLVIAVLGLFSVVLARLQNEETTKKMVTGIAAGIAFVVGLFVVIVTLWCCCCSKLTEKRRVSPANLTRHVDVRRPNDVRRPADGTRHADARSTSADSRRSSDIFKTT